MELVYSIFKALVIARNMPVTFVDQNDGYWIFAGDGQFSFHCIIGKSTQPEDAADFLANLAPKANQSAGPLPFAQPQYRTKNQATSAIASVNAGESGVISMQLAAEKFASGGSLIVKNAEFGDYVTAEVKDISSLIPAAYRAATCEAWPVVNTYVEKMWIAPKGVVTEISLDTYPLNAKIPAGMHLCITYHSAAAGSARDIVVNYNMQRKL
jgi:hypothetical protein